MADTLADECTDAVGDWRSGCPVRKRIGIMEDGGACRLDEFSVVGAKPGGVVVAVVAADARPRVKADSCDDKLFS